MLPMLSKDVFLLSSMLAAENDRLSIYCSRWRTTRKSIQHKVTRMLSTLAGQQALAKTFFVAIIIASILNGSVFWLKRVGWLEPDIYNTYLDEIQPEPGRDWGAIGKKEIRAKLYQHEGLQIVFKLAKDLLTALFIIISGFLIGQQRTDYNRRYYITLIGLVGVSGFAFFNSYVSYGLMLPLAGTRSFFFMFAGMLGCWAIRNNGLGFLAQCFLVFLFVQLLLVPVELIRGLHIFGAHFFGTEFSDRIVGTMLQPSSLGIIAVFSFVFYYLYSESRRQLALAGLAMSVLVFFSGSATALLLWLIATAGVFYKRLNQTWAMFISILGVMIFVTLLPMITGRHDVYNSLWGRISIFERHVLADSSVLETLFGKGLGVGTNIAANLFMDWQTSEPKSLGSDVIFIADSTPVALISQVGIVGMLLFYLLLVYSAWREPRSRLIYIIIAVASMATNIVELFPVNIVLGLLIAHSLTWQNEVLSKT